MFPNPYVTEQMAKAQMQERQREAEEARFAASRRPKARRPLRRLVPALVLFLAASGILVVV